MTRSQKPKKATPAAEIPPRPIVTIYQNSDHVAGILQQLFSAPLVTDESREHGGSSTSGEKAENKGTGGAKGGFSAPFVGEVGVDLSGGRTSSHDSGLTSSAKTVQNFKFSQAYYLLQVRGQLSQRGLIRTLARNDDAADLKSGDFVEFEASFEPNAIHALLDIVTPELVRAITEHHFKQDVVRDYPEEFPSMDELRAYSERMLTRATIHAEVAKAIAQAVRVDFRAEKTREFYGDTGKATAITICDNAHFTVEDEDRILDGSFTVLGKVTEDTCEDRPILSRNKLLNRLSPELVDSVFEMLRRSARSEAMKLDLGDGEVREIQNAFDFKLPSRILGPSFKVVPIAIYA